MAVKTFYVARLRFLSGLHLALDRDNNYDESDDRLRSDTLMSALYACALELGLAKPDDPSFMERYQLSSAFPYWQGKATTGPVYFLPRPLKPNLAINYEDNTTEHRKIKAGIEYFDLPLFERVIANDDNIVLKEDNLSKNKRLASTQSIAELQIFDNTPYQHVSIREWEGKEPVPYYVEKLFFEKDCGLFFLIDCDKEHINDLQACLRLLADNGIGTDRSSGNGAFNWTKEDWGTLPIQIPDNPDGRWMSLSLFIPKTPQDLGDLGKAAYELSKRGGYIASSSTQDYTLITLRKKSIMAFEEGSLLQTSNAPNGHIANLKPTDTTNMEKEKIDALHPIYRSGRAIFIPTNLKS
jgi:CRISPR-associated protein Csm4